MLVGDGGERVVIPRDVVLDVLGVDALWEQGSRWFCFDPDGASSGAVLLVYSREEAGYEIRVNWYTGGVAIVVRAIAGDSKQAGFTAPAEALVALTIVLALAGVLAPLEFHARRIVLHADDRVAAQILLRALLQDPARRPRRPVAGLARDGMRN